LFKEAIGAETIDWTEKIPLQDLPNTPRLYNVSSYGILPTIEI